MADVFISYSRKDADFVAKLAAALGTAGHDTWVDTQGIRASEDWKAKIFREIDAAGTFLFVVSPDSLQSEVANEEINHASSNRKRMIPLFYREADYNALPPALGRIQAIKFDDDGLFPAGLSQLLSTLETDLDWVDAHTRLLTRAKEWEAQKKDRSFLLRGKDLNEAEQMVAKAADREPRLTALQSEYILASRQTTTKTQRIVMGAVAAAAVVALVLAAAAWWQRGLARKNAAEAQRQKKTADANAKTAQENEAEAKHQKGVAQEKQKEAEVNANEAKKQQSIAEQNARESKAGELAALSTGSLAEDDPERSILLAMQAANATMSHGQGPLPSAEEALHQAILLSPIRMTLRGHAGPLWVAAFSPDGKRLATASADQTAKVWDAESGKELLTLRGHAGPVYDVAFSPDGKRLATAGTDHTVKLWEAESGTELLTLRGHAYAVKGVAFSPDGKRLATAGEDQTAKLWESDGGQELLTLRGHGGPLLGVAFSSDGKRLASASYDGSVQVYEIDIHELLKLARSRVTRNLTPDECLKYFQSKTCPPLP